MKTIKLIGLLSIFLISSCSIKSQKETDPEYSDYGFYMYELLLCISDASGVNIIKNIECEWYTDCKEGDIGYTDNIGFLKKDLYSLKIIFPEPCQDIYALHHKPRTGYIPDPDFAPYLGLGAKEDRYYLGFSTKTCKNPTDYGNCPAAEMLTFKLSFPYIFGDDVELEIITLWQSTSPEIYHKHKPRCTHIEIVGYKTSSIIKYDEHGTSVASVTLEEKSKD